MEEKLLNARLDDIKKRCFNSEKPQFIGFLSESEAALANRYLKNCPLNVSFFGGYDGALRTFLCIAPDYCENINLPITPITAMFRKQDKLAHRDFLGAITALGILREKIGDILIEEGRAVIFADSKISDFIISQIEKVGNVGVELSEGASPPLPEAGKCSEFSDTVASARLDCVVAALCNTSRNKASELINGSFVSINSFLCERPTQTVRSGDRISIRKKGRFNIVSIDGISKKGRIILKYEKYI